MKLLRLLRFAIFTAIRRALSRVSNLLRMVDAAGRKAAIVYLANFPEGGAGFGAAGLTSWSTTIRTGGAQQVGDAAVAGRMLGGGELGPLHRPPPAL
jgi:hypothetical protein